MKVYARAVITALLILFVAACNTETSPATAPPTENSFSFNIDPQTQTVELLNSHALLQTLNNNLQCGLEKASVLRPTIDLALSHYDIAFLPNNQLKIIAKFKNVSPYAYAALMFERVTGKHILGSTEPAPVALLASQEETAELEFLVHHKGRVFTYEVVAKAEVLCEENGEADLEVTKTGPESPIILSTETELSERLFIYNVKVKNKGSEVAENVVLSDIFEAPFPIAPDVSLDGRCTIEDELRPAALPNRFSLGISCDLGTLNPGEETSFSFGYFLESRLQQFLKTQAEPLLDILLVNTAEAMTSSPESNLDNNKASVETSVLLQEMMEPYVDLALKKTGAATAQLGDLVAYTITVKNNGTQTATGVRVMDKLFFSEAIQVGNSGLCTYNLEVISDGEYDVADCYLPDLAPGAEQSFVINVDYQAVGTATNTAEVSSNEGETPERLLDNSDEVVTEVLFQEPELGSITIRKNVDTADFEDLLFNFSFEGTPFQLSENSADYVRTDLPAGTYNVTEIVPDNWDLVSIDCGPNNNTGAADGVNIVLEAGENEVCTFNNEYLPPVPAIDLELSLTGDARTPTNYPSSYEFVVKNLGDQTATSAKVEIFFYTSAANLASFDFDDFDGLSCGSSVSGSDAIGTYQKVSCTLPSHLASMRSFSGYVWANFASPGDVLVKVVASANEAEPDEANNSDELTTTVFTATPDGVNFWIQKQVRLAPSVGTGAIPADVTIPDVHFDWSCSDSSSGNLTIPGTLLRDNGFETVLVRQVPKGETCEVTERVADLPADWQIFGEVSKSKVFDSQGTIVFVNEYAPDVASDIADLRMTKLIEFDDPIFAGSNIEYVLDVRNLSSVNAAKGVVVTDILPAGLSFVEFNSGNASDCSAAASTITCNFGELAPGTSKFTYLVVKVSDSATKGQVFSNTATVSSSTTDPVLSNNAATESFVVRIVEADIEVEKSIVTTAPYHPGDEVEFEIYVANVDVVQQFDIFPFAAENVVLTDILPAGLSYLSSEVFGTTASCSENSGTITCDLGTLDGFSIDEIYVYIRVRINADVSGTLSNTATVTTSTPDPDLSDNSSTVSFNVTATVQ